MNGNNSLRERYSRPSNEPEEEIEEVENDTPDDTSYIAYAKARGGRRGELGIKMYHADGQTIEVLYYSYLMRVIATSPDVMALMCTDCVYTITGNDLTPLLSLLRDHKIIFLQAFNPNKHPPLAANESEMVINDILIQSNDEWWDAMAARRAVRQKEDA